MVKGKFGNRVFRLEKFPLSLGRGSLRDEPPFKSDNQRVPKNMRPLGTIQGDSHPDSFIEIPNSKYYTLKT